MKENKLSIQRIDELMNVFDLEVSCALHDSLKKDFGTFSRVVGDPDFISVNHLDYFDMMLHPFMHFKEFKGLFDCFYYSDNDEMLISPEHISVIDYESDDEIPTEIKKQLRPITRDDVLELADKIGTILYDLGVRLHQHLYCDLEDEGLTLSDFEKKHKLKDLECLLDQAMYTYFDSFGNYFVKTESVFEYLYYRWLDEDPKNYKQLESTYFKELEEQQKKEEAYTNQLLAWEERFTERLRFSPEMEETDEEIEAEVGFNIAYYNYLRDHVFHFIKE